MFTEVQSMGKNSFKGKEIKLTKHRISYYNRDVYLFSWWTGDRKRSFCSIGSSPEEALIEFRAEYPDAKGCLVV